MRMKVQKVLQILLAKFEELQEMRRIQMEMYSMSPRSFNSINKKLFFLRDLCQQFLYKLKDLFESNIDTLDYIFKLECPQFN